MIAVSVLVVGFLGITTLLSRALGLNRVVADNYTATYLAAEGIEVAKNILDGNALQGRPWNAGFANGDFEVEYSSVGNMISQPNCTDRNLLYDASFGRYNYRSGTETSFERCVSVMLIGPDEVQVNSRIEWITRGGGAFSIDLEDHFYNWRS